MDMLVARRLTLSVLIMLCLGTVGVAAAQWSPHADTIFTNGSVVTVDREFNIAQAVAIKDGKLIAVGRNEDALAHRGPETRVIELGGKTLLPGLCDSHIHFTSLGRDTNDEADLTLAMNAEEILEAVRELKERRNPPAGEWLIGNRWDQYKYPEMVTRWQLDELAPEHRVFLRRVYRGAVVNTAVLNEMGIYDERPETWPSWWLEDPPDFTFEDRIFRAERELMIDGERRTVKVPTGAFVGVRGTALVTVRPPAPTLEEDVRSVRLGVTEMLSLGVTSIVDPSSRMGRVMQIYQEAYNRGWLKLRVAAVYEGTFNTHEPDFIREHLSTLRINNLGDRFLRWRGTKFYSDGGAGTRSAWVSETFDRWREFEGAENFGNPVTADSEVREQQYRAAIDNGWDLHTHAAGDVAMRQATDLYIKLMGEIKAQRPDADLRWSLIHAYLPIEEGTRVDGRRVVDDMARHGIIAASNPVFQWQEGAAFATNVGEDRMARMQPFRSYVEAGVIVASGSDFSVTSHDPWIGLYALLTRRDQASGKVYGPEETLGLADALRTYTINGAYLTYDEDWKGSIEVGKAADLVVVDLPDIMMLERDPELCFEMRDKVLMTLVDGEVVWERE